MGIRKGHVKCMDTEANLKWNVDRVNFFIRSVLWNSSSQQRVNVHNVTVASKALVAFGREFWQHKAGHAFQRAQSSAVSLPQTPRRQMDFFHYANQGSVHFSDVGTSAIFALNRLFSDMGCNWRVNIIKVSSFMRDICRKRVLCSLRIQGLVSR